MPFQEQIKKNREIFLRFNEVKYRRFQQLITNNNLRRVINSIPHLLCVNNKNIPGYIEGNIPYGIVNFEPDEDTKKYIQGRFHVRNLEFKKDNHFIEMLGVMGSVGTIGYTKESDFDYWVCIDKSGVSAEVINNFQKKIDAIQNWAMDEIKIDVHLFVNDIDSIKNNIFAEDEEEAFGSTIGAVLKDEFFRSSIVIAGKVPFWWVIPRFVRDSEYENLYNRLTDEEKKYQFIDLGNLYEISKVDFLGAALFQLIKSLGNPFKSIIKIGVLEKYLFKLDHSPLLSQKVKSNILQENFDIKIVDSYILMFEEVYNYYESVIEDKNLLKILRQNLYLKIDSQLSKYLGMKESKNLPYKVVVMFKYIKEWSWSINEIKSLDNFDNWDYNEIMIFWNKVKKFMLLSYQKITTQLPTMNLEQKVSESDFKLLSRKIKTHFTSEKNKIDHYVTFKDTPYESILYIEPTNKSIDEHEWSLSKRNTSLKDKFISTILKIESDLVKLIAWTSINQIFNPTFSRLKIQSGYSRINQNLVVELLTKISNLFLMRINSLKNEYFLMPVFNTANMVIINFSLEKADSIQTIHHLYQTSWGESYINKYKSEGDLVHILAKILNDGLILKNNFEDYCVIVTPEPFKKHYKEIEQLFREAYEFIVQNEKKISTRFVACLGKQYITIFRDRDTVNIDADTNLITVLAKITSRPKKDVINKFYGEDSRLQILNEIYKIRKINSITIVYEERGDFIFVYLINERGNLFTFVKPKNIKEEIIIYMFDFCQNVINRINSYNYLPEINIKTPVYSLLVDKFGRPSFNNETKSVEEIYIVKYKVQKSLVATVSKSISKETLYNIAFQGNSASDFIPLKQVPDKIIALGKGSNGSINILSDVVFKDLKKEDILIGSTLYFLEKYRLEFLIDKILK